MVDVRLDLDILRPLLVEIVRTVLAEMEADRVKISETRLAFSEAEAAAMLGLHVHQLRDERRRNRLNASMGPGRKILYSRSDLLGYLQSRPWQKGGGQ